MLTNDLIKATPLWLSEVFQTKLYKIIERRRSNERESEIKKMITEIEALDVTASSIIYRLADWNTRAAVLGQKDAKLTCTYRWIATSHRFKNEGGGILKNSLQDSRYR